MKVILLATPGDDVCAKMIEQAQEWAGNDSYYRRNPTMVGDVYCGCRAVNCDTLPTPENVVELLADGWSIRWMKKSGAYATITMDDESIRLEYVGRRHALAAIVDVIGLQPALVYSYETTRPDLAWWETAT